MRQTDIDYMYERLITEAEDSDDKNEEKEIKKRKRDIVKKIAATVVIIGALKLVITNLQKNGDDEGAQKVKDAHDKLSQTVDSINPNDIQSVSDAKVIDKKLDNIQKQAKHYKLNAVRTTNKYGDEVKYTGSMARRKFKYDNVKEDLRRSDKELVASVHSHRKGHDKAAQAHLNNAKKYDNRARYKATKGYYGIKSSINKRKNMNESVNNEYIRYEYMIESICERYDYDLVSFESAMEMVDTIYDKLAI